MANLPRYLQFDEKDFFFNQNFFRRKIDSMKDVEQLLTHMKSNRDSIWRGSEATFKFYNSFQRFWISNDLEKTGSSPQEYFNHILKEASKWSRSIIGKWYNAYGLKGNADFFVFSLLRHHGVPVPLLDFTRNPFVALFFGIDSTSNDSGGDQLNSYFSVYEITREHVLCYPPFKQYALESLEGGDDFKKEFSRRKAQYQVDGIEYPDRFIRKDMCEEFIHNLATNHLSIPKRDLPILVEDLPRDEIRFKLFSNLNIIAQEGLFIAYANPNKSLEESVEDYAMELCEKNGYGKDKYEEIMTRQREQFRCFNIHKSLKEEIKNILDKEFDINSQSMYPDLYQLSKVCSDTFLVGKRATIS